jgi:hypothetical protein
MLVAVITFLFLSVPGQAQNAVVLREVAAPGAQYHITTRVDLSGTLKVPAPDSKQGGEVSRPLAITGTSTIEYHERLLASADPQVHKAIRIYRRIDLQRKLGNEPQESTLRHAVRRLVILRMKNAKVPFSPDGALTWGEIDLLRTDIFTASLTGLLPDRPVRPGDRWAAGGNAVQELTDLERIEEGSLECRFEEAASLAGRRHARVALSGTVRGINEDGPTRQQIDGQFWFDLESNHLSYLAFRGVHVLLDGAGKEAGRIEGRFVLTRQANQQSPDLSDAALRGLTLEPNADNTLLLYDNPDLGIRFHYPRRWRIGAATGRQLVLEEVNGNGLLLTVEPLTRVPTGAQFLAESREFLEKQKGKVLRVYPPHRVQAPPQELERFSLDVETEGQNATLTYWVIRQPLGGATIAARLKPADLTEMYRDLERIAGSVVITTRQK